MADVALAPLALACFVLDLVVLLVDASEFVASAVVVIGVVVAIGLVA